MPRIECLAVDLDGTLTDSEGVIHHEVVEALERLKMRNVKVVIVTGASYPAAITLAYYLPVTRFAVAENGGVVGFRDKYKLLGSRGDKEKILAVVREHLKEVLVESWQNEYRMVDMAFKPAAGLSPEEAARLAAAELEPLGFEAVYSGWAIHVHRFGVNKAAGLLEACKALGVEPGRVAAVGDSAVDEPMLEAAGFGVALANSPDSLKRKADHVTVESHYLGFLEAVDFLENSGFL
jgi:phosphoglycolate phosphatase (TIGR01487 family)